MIPLAHCIEIFLDASSANVDIKYIGGKDPEMVFYDEAGSVVQVRVSLISMVNFHL